MKKRITLKILTVLTVAFFAVNVNAQILTDYVQAVAGESIDTVTNSSTTRIYVMPDFVFSSAYDSTAGGAAGLGANQRWTWVGNFTKAAANENWFELSWDTINSGASGTYTTQVTETNTLLSCNDGGVTVTVEVIDSTTVTFTPDGAGFFGNASYNLCANDARLGTDVVQAAFTNAQLGAVTPTYQIQYTLTVDTTNDGGTNWGAIAGLAQTYSGAAGSQEAVAVNATTHNLAAPTGGFITRAGAAGLELPARYTYTINGVTDRISRKSDYLTNSVAAANAWTWYDTAPETVVIVVNPTPITGPIYHISNMWAN